jgi:Holliday junction resolvasome RuvABC endonuclease subunit
MIIAGLDVATHLGVAIWSEGVIVHRETIYFPGDKAHKANHPARFARFQKYAAAIEDLLTQWAVSHVMIEGYGYANPHTLVTLVELGTLVRQVLHESEARWEEVPPPTLKKFTTGRGNAKKDEIMLAVYKRFGVECKSNDEADAVALAFFGAVRLGHDVAMPQAQRDVALGLDKRKSKK